MEVDYLLFPLCPYKQQMSAEVEQGKVGLDSGGNVGFEVKQSWARAPNQPQGSLGLGTWLWGKTPSDLDHVR